MGREANTTTGLAAEQSVSDEETRRMGSSHTVAGLFLLIFLVLASALAVNSPMLGHKESARFEVFIKPPKTVPSPARQDVPTVEQPAETGSNPQP